MTSEWTAALLGGVLIGLSAALLLLTHGRIAGISGILGGLLTPAPPGEDKLWRAGFLLALLAGGFLLVGFYPDRFRTLGMPRWPVLLIAGLLVGFGTRLGGGCTSGHGVCGIGRGSPRSLAATLTFMATAIITVLITRHFL
ncbi:MAG: protein of unknown function YeeE/YedE [Myxococcaceae bacterium]|nr:protein of unknown function YeeE/YedE [Myxococcaceae bacterium]